jgi:HK97 gp10 family phage protein
MSDVSIEGLDKIFANLDRIEAMLEAKTDEAINNAGEACEKEAKAKARVSKNPPEGHVHMRDRIEHEHHDLSSEVTSEADYSIYNEFGTRFMSAAPFMRPGYQAGKKLIEAELKGIL